MDPKAIVTMEQNPIQPKRDAVELSQGSPQAAASSAIEEYHVHSKDDLLDGSEHDVAERDDSGHDDAGNKDDSEHDHAENMVHPEHYTKTGNDPEQDTMPQEGYESRAVGKLLDIMDKKEIELNLPYQGNTALTVETMIIHVDSVFKNIHVPSTLFNKFVLVDDKGKVTSRIIHRYVDGEHLLTSLQEFTRGNFLCILDGKVYWLHQQPVRPLVESTGTMSRRKPAVLRPAKKREFLDKRLLYA